MRCHERTRQGTVGPSLQLSIIMFVRDSCSKQTLTGLLPTSISILKDPSFTVPPPFCYTREKGNRWKFRIGQKEDAVISTNFPQEKAGDGVKTKKRSWRPSILSLNRELLKVAANSLRSARWRTAASSPAGLVAAGARAWTSRPMASSRCASSPATMTTLWKSSCSRSVPACLLGLSFGGLHPTRILWECAPCGWHAHSDAPHKLPAGRV